MNKLKLNNKLTLKNGTVIPSRIMKSATSEQLGDKQRNPKNELAKLYETWSYSGAGLLITGNIMVDRSALGEPFNVVLDDESDLKKFKNWTRSGTINGNQLWAQLNHPGKQIPSILSKTPVAPSAVPLAGDLAKAFTPPRELTDSEIQSIIHRFALSARLAKDVGFTGVQIHGAHGYLVSQFLSPRHNQRTDRWGGNPEKRMRFVLEVYRSIRAEVGDDFPIAIKLNSADFQKGGFTEDESILVVEKLVESGIDFVEISGGTYENPTMVTGETSRTKESTRKREAFFLKYAESLRKHTDVPLAITGGFRSTEGMEFALNSGATDIVGLARPMILMPDLPKKAFNDSKFVFNWNEPTTGFPKLDRMVMLSLIWYEKQMWRVGRGGQTKLEQSSWLAAISSIWKVFTSPPISRRT